MKVILKIYAHRKFAQHSFYSDLEDFRYMNPYANKNQLMIKIPGHVIHYLHDINYNTDKLRGWDVDVVEIMHNCVDQDVINSVIAPICNNGAEIFFIE